MLTNTGFERVVAFWAPDINPASSARSSAGVKAWMASSLRARLRDQVELGQDGWSLTLNATTHSLSSSCLRATMSVTISTSDSYGHEHVVVVTPLGGVDGAVPVLVLARIRCAALEAIVVAEQLVGSAVREQHGVALAAVVVDVA